MMTTEQPNVVLVVLDTVRGLDTVPASESGLPTLARLAGEGTEYRRAFASAPWTLPSHAGLFTGTYTSNHDTHGDNRTLDECLPTLPELFSAAGYRTLGISNNTWISGEFGFDRGFDDLESAWSREGDGSSGPDDGSGLSEHEWRTEVTKRCGATPTTDRATEWMSAGSDDPLFLFLNYIDAHFDYAPPREYVEGRLPAGYDYEDALAVLSDPMAYNAGDVELTRTERSVLRALYRGELARLDDALSRLVSGLRAAGEWENTVLVVTSDHGENVGEHGLVGHQFALYDTLLHVPLIVTGGAVDRATGTDRLVQLTDLAPTLLDAAGIEARSAREGFQGRSFHPSSSAPAREYVVAEHVTPQPPISTLRERFGDLPSHVDALDRSLPLRAVRTDAYKLVRGADGSQQLYAVDGEPAETETVTGRRTAVREAMAERLDRWLASFDDGITETGTSVSAETEKRLRDLGYL